MKLAYGHPGRGSHASIPLPGGYKILAAVAVAVTLGGIAVWKPVAGLGLAFVAAGATIMLRSTDRIIFWCIFLLYSNIVVVAVRFHGVPKVASAAVPAMLVLPLVYLLVFRRRRPVFTSALPFLLFYFAVHILSAAFSRHGAAARAGVIEVFLEGVLIYFLVTNVIRSWHSLRVATWALLAAGLLMSIGPVFQQLTKSFDNNLGGLAQTTELGFRTGETSERGVHRQLRMSGTIGEQNRFAQNLLMLLPLGFFQWRHARGRKMKMAAVILTGFAACGFVLAFSRGAFLAFVVIIALMLMMRLLTRRHLIVMGLGVLAVLVTMPQIVTRLSTLKKIPALFAPEVSEETEPDGSIKGRATEMAAAALVFFDHPVVGVGPGAFKFYSGPYGNKLGIRKLKGTREAHTLFLGIAAESGFLGLTSFMIMVLVTLYGLSRARKQWLARNTEVSDTLSGYLLAMIAYLVTGIFLHMAYQRFFFLVFGLAGTALALADSQSASQSLRSTPSTPATGQPRFTPA